MSFHSSGNHRADSPYGENSADGGSADAPAGDDAPGEAEPAAPTPAAPGGAEPKKSRRDEDPDAVLQFADAPVASLDELRAAMTWAFAAEEVTPELLDRFAAHAQYVLEGNRVMNLTAIVAPKEVAAKHYLDSWRTTRLLSLLGRSVLDLGTGAGFPGMPIAFAEPQARVCMLDSTHKRIDFVARGIEKFGLRNATAVAGRAEDHLARNKYDIVLMRAVSSIRENVRLLRKVRHSHKDLVMLKGPSWSREARAAEREGERLGFRLDTVWEHTLPGDLGARAFLVFRAPGGHGN